ncbi:MAG: cation-translocating P-type ATPase [Anaerolineae bacterium]
MAATEAQLAWHELDVEQVRARLRTRVDGLSDDEAQRRLQETGPNRLASDEGPKPLVILLRQVQSPLIYILIAASVVTILLGDIVDTVVILAVVVLNSALGFLQEYKAEQALQALSRLAAQRARVLRDGHERQVDAQDLVPGDVVLLEAGSRVPADVRVTRAIDLQVDESALTGESLAVTKTEQPLAGADLPVGDRRNMAFLGTAVVRGRGSGIVVETGVRTAFGGISTQVREVGETKTPLQRRLDSFSRVIALAVLGVTTLVVALGLLAGEALADILLTAVATAVATVPEGLPVTITVALAVGVSRMAKRRAIIRKLAAVETLGSCTYICSDKTGTLTKNEMTVTRIVAGDRDYSVTGSGYDPQGQIEWEGQQAELREHPALELILRIGLLTNESDVYQQDGEYRAVGDPTEAALIVAASKGGLDPEWEREAYQTVDEVPFASERRYMATLHSHGGAKVIFVKGAPERVLGMCERQYVPSSVAVGFPGSGVAAPPSLAELNPQAILETSSSLAEQGLRVLAFACRDVPAETTELSPEDVEHGLEFVGLQGMIDPPRPEAIEAVVAAQGAGLSVVMVTGDHRVTAEAIARRMGISNPARQTLEGAELQRLSDDELYDRVRHVAVFARSAPEDKLRIVQQLRRHGEVVAVTGDGVNDAPALKQADIGVAMGIAGTDVAREASDMVLADDNFATIYAAVEQGRIVFDNIRKVILFLIPTGLGLVLTILASIVLRLPVPFLPAQVIWINLVTNGLQDVAMGFEPAEEDVGRRPPRNPREPLYTRLMVQRTALVGVILLAGTLGVFFYELQVGPDLSYARSAAMTTMVLFQNFYILSCRSFRQSAFRMNPLGNRFLLFAVISALVLQVLALYWGPLRFVLRTEPLTLANWLLILPVAALVLLAVEIDKALRRRQA